MKKLVYFIMAVAAVAAASSCKKGGEEEAKPVTVTVTINAPTGAEWQIPSSYKVNLASTTSSINYSASSENGVAVFKDVIPGIYNVNASATVVDGGFTWIVSASQDGANILADTQLTLDASAVKESALVFKEIYTTGCKIGEGEWDTYFRDQFYEIYNNSTETVYADGLCFAVTDHYTYDYSIKYEFDIPDADKYLYCSTAIWMIPGNGTEYPVKPGESIVLAQWATNHNAENLANGHSIDNSGADFEFIEGESTLYNGTVITDGPAINLKMVTLPGYAMPQYLTSTGGCGYVLFKPSKPLRTEDFLVPTNYEYSKFCEIAIADVIDAVQRIQDETIVPFPQLPNSLDAGNIWASAPGYYTFESIVRKVASTRDDGTVVLLDTNNTTNDFDLSTPPAFRRSGAKLPSWNTWCK